MSRFNFNKVNTLNK